MLKALTCVFVFFTFLIFLIVNVFVRKPYMDEIFHYPQALKYYNGSFSEWDPKITTPPGLYLSSVTILIPLSKLIEYDLRKIEYFRITNLFFTFGNFFLLYKILRLQHLKEEERFKILSAMNISMFPVLYFFTFLYYTDCGSVFFVLLMYYWNKKYCFISAAVAGALSIFFRQTNIVWVFYLAADETLHILMLLFNEALIKKDKEISDLTFPELIKISQPFWKDHWKELLMQMIEVNLGYFAVGVGFVLFVAINGSVALGDKAAHQVCLNLPQILYFLLFCLFFASPYLISWHKTKEFVSFVYSHKLCVTLMFIAFSFCIIFMSHVHPYLLADNRHLTFYIWRRFLGRNMLLSLLLVPIYIYSCWSVFCSVQEKNAYSKLVLAFCVIISTVPQKLLELRYFIIPYIMLRIHIKSETKWQPYLEFLLYALVNYLVLYLFLFKTFMWHDSEEVQRFMW